MLIFDVETGPLPDERLHELFDGQFKPPEPPGEFDQASVKTGNLKDPAKIDAKIAEARAAHDLAVKNHAANVEQARNTWWQEIKEMAALSPVTGQILAIGYKNAENGKYGIDEGLGDNGCIGEQVIIENFWKQYQRCRSSARRMVGFNIIGFDVPFIIRRSWLLGVDVPDTVIEKSRYLDSIVFVDLLPIWGVGSHDSIKLDTLAKALGVGGKPDGVNGGDFARLWVENRPLAYEYLANDLDMTAKVAARMGLVA